MKISKIIVLAFLLSLVVFGTNQAEAGKFSMGGSGFKLSKPASVVKSPPQTQPTAVPANKSAAKPTLQEKSLSTGGDGKNGDAENPLSNRSSFAVTSARGGGSSSSAHSADNGSWFSGSWFSIRNFWFWALVFSESNSRSSQNPSAVQTNNCSDPAKVMTTPEGSSTKCEKSKK